MQRLTLSMMIIVSATATSVPTMTLETTTICSISDGCCAASNYNSSGPLTLVPGTGDMDERTYGEPSQLYGCVEHYTSFLWFKEINGTKVLYPFGADDPSRFELARHNQTLFITKTDYADGGDYWYIASNGTASVTGSFFLRVDCKQTSVDFSTKEEAERYVDLGSNVTLRCAISYLCPDLVKLHSVYWTWHDQTSNSSLMLDKSPASNLNNTVIIYCKPLNVDCSLVVNPVREQHYRGTFVCKMTGNSQNQTVQLKPPEIVTTSWKPIIINVTLAVAVLASVTAFILFRYGHRLAFWFRRLEPRGHFRHDAVIVYFEDHEKFAKNVLKPFLQELGYNVLEEEARHGEPEALAKAEAILSSYCVVLTLSDLELLEEPSARNLVDVAKCRANKSVVFVRCPNFTYSANNRPVHARGSWTQDEQGCTGAPWGTQEEVAESASPWPGQKCCDEAGSDAKGTHEAEVSGVSSQDDNEKVSRRGCKYEQRPLIKTADSVLPSNRKNIWKDERLKGFRVLNWPGADQTGEVKTDSIKVEKFWYSLRSKLPKLEKKSKKTSVCAIETNKNDDDDDNDGLFDGIPTDELEIYDEQTSEPLPNSKRHKNRKKNLKDQTCGTIFMDSTEDCGLRVRDSHDRPEDYDSSGPEQESVALLYAAQEGDFHDRIHSSNEEQSDMVNNRRSREDLHAAVSHCRTLTPEVTDSKQVTTPTVSQKILTPKEDSIESLKPLQTVRDSNPEMSSITQLPKLPKDGTDQTGLQPQTSVQQQDASDTEMPSQNQASLQGPHGEQTATMPAAVSTEKPRPAGAKLTFSMLSSKQSRDENPKKPLSKPVPLPNSSRAVSPSPLKPPKVFPFAQSSSPQELTFSLPDNTVPGQISSEQTALPTFSSNTNIASTHEREITNPDATNFSTSSHPVDILAGEKSESTQEGHGESQLIVGFRSGDNQDRLLLEENGSKRPQLLGSQESGYLSMSPSSNLQQDNTQLLNHLLNQHASSLVLEEDRVDV